MPEGGQGIEGLEDRVGAVLRPRVGPAIDVPPLGRRVGPDEQLEPGDQSVVGLVARAPPGQQRPQRPGLHPPEDADARARDEDVPPADPVVLERRAVAVPRLQVEGAVALAAGLLERAEPAGQLVADQPDAVRGCRGAIPRAPHRGVASRVSAQDGLGRRFGFGRGAGQGLQHRRPFLATCGGLEGVLRGVGLHRRPRERPAWCSTQGGLACRSRASASSRRRGLVASVRAGVFITPGGRHRAPEVRHHRPVVVPLRAGSPPCGRPRSASATRAPTDGNRAGSRPAPRCPPARDAGRRATCLGLGSARAAARIESAPARRARWRAVAVDIPTQPAGLASRATAAVRRSRTAARRGSPRQSRPRAAPPGGRRGPAQRRCLPLADSRGGRSPRGSWRRPTGCCGGDSRRTATLPVSFARALRNHAAVGSVTTATNVPRSTAAAGRGRASPTIRHRAASGSAAIVGPPSQRRGLPSVPIVGGQTDWACLPPAPSRISRSGRSRSLSVALSVKSANSGDHRNSL